MPSKKSNGSRASGWLASLRRGLLWLTALVFGAGLAPQVLFHEELTMAATTNDDTVFVGHGVLGIEVQPVREVGELEETMSDCDIAPSIKGSAPTAALAYQQAGGAPSVMGLITGADAPGNLLADMAVRVFPKLRRIATATSTRMSSIVPSGRRSGATITWTNQTLIDEAATFAHVEPWLRRPRRLVLASMSAEQAPLIRRLFAESPCETCLLLTRSQCEDRETTFELAKWCGLVQLTAGELEAWTGIRGDVAGGINCLRDRGVTQVIVTDGQRGLTAFLDGEWHHQPAFCVEQNSSASQCDEIIFGTYLASRDQGHSIGDALRFAAAAIAMSVAKQVRCHRGLDELIAFASTTPTRSYAPDSRPSLVKAIDRVVDGTQPLVRKAAYVATGAVGVTLMVAIAQIVGFA